MKCVIVIEEESLLSENVYKSKIHLENGVVNGQNLSLQNDIFPVHHSVILITDRDFCCSFS